MSALASSERGWFSLLGIIGRGQLLPADELAEGAVAALPDLTLVDWDVPARRIVGGSGAVATDFDPAFDRFDGGRLVGPDGWLDGFAPGDVLGVRLVRDDTVRIERIDAAGDYMCIYTADNSLILRETMKDLERRLDPRVFQRVHRSWIVNLNLVRQVKPHTNGECFLVLESGAQVKVSRSYRDVVARFVH